MGWGIYLYPEIYYSKVDYRTKDDVLREIESVKNVISSLERKLEGLAMMTEPAKMMSKEDIEEGISPMEWVRHEVFQILGEDYSSLKDYYYELFKLEWLYDYWDAAHNENNKAVHPPLGSFNWPRTAYMCGDYVESVLEDGTDPQSKENQFKILSKEKQDKVSSGELVWSEQCKEFIPKQNESDMLFEKLIKNYEDEICIRSY